MKRKRLAVPSIVLGVAFGVAFVTGSSGGSSSGGTTTPPPVATRTWMMGFSAFPPHLDNATLVHGVDLWSKRAELAIIHEELPWKDLLAGVAPDTIIDQRYAQLVAYFRGKA